MDSQTKGYTTPLSVKVRVGQSTACGYKQFCGSYMYQGPRTFKTKQECENTLPIIVQDDPVSATPSVNKTTAQMGENVALTVMGRDGQGASKVGLLSRVVAHERLSCKNDLSFAIPNVCTRSFVFCESTPGTKYYYGYAYARRLDGSAEGTYTSPTNVSVIVFSASTQSLLTEIQIGEQIIS